MKIILASANKGKIKELQNLLQNDEVIPYSDITGPFDIEETGTTFQENAVIKAQAVVDALKEKDYQEECIVISDDSGITVPVLNNEPGIYSARYSGSDASDKSNNKKLISKLKENNISKTPAFYTACLAVAYNGSIYTTHGWMHGEVIDKEIGSGGFGYDPLFIPKGFDETLGTLPVEIKKSLSHRTKALDLALKLIKSLVK
ncbi:MAG: non-canonical purine NTP pyrophosphatase [Campylobacterota bacterium]|nr:non-canonical purine NTP pyrophosphatase [Campylobacterota bacterium]